MTAIITCRNMWWLDEYGIIKTFMVLYWSEKTNKQTNIDWTKKKWCYPNLRLRGVCSCQEWTLNRRHLHNTPDDFRSCNGFSSKRNRNIQCQWSFLCVFHLSPSLLTQAPHPKLNIDHTAPPPPPPPPTSKQNTDQPHKRLLLYADPQYWPNCQYSEGLLCIRCCAFRYSKAYTSDIAMIQVSRQSNCVACGYHGHG